MGRWYLQRSDLLKDANYAKMRRMLKEEVIEITLFAFQMMGIAAPDDLRGLLCEGRDLDRYILFDNPAEKEAFQNVSCSLSPRQLIDTRRELLRNLDGGKLLSQVTHVALLPIGSIQGCGGIFAVNIFAPQLAASHFWTNEEAETSANASQLAGLLS